MRKIELVKQELSAHLIPSEIDWAFELADLAERADLSLVVLRRCASDLAWLAREIGQRFPDDDDWARCDSAANPGAARRALAYVHGFRLRFDFKFDQLERMTRVWLADVPDDALIHSLAAFAALGQLSDRAEPLLRQAVATPGYDTTCRWVCLHGLWFGTNLPDQAERIIELSDEMTGRGEDRANLYYWRAFALRRLGPLP